MTTELIEPFVRHRGPITSAIGVPGTPLVLTSGYDGAVALFDLETREVRLLGYHNHLANRAAVARDGRRAATASADHTIYIWDLASGAVERVLKGHSDDVEDFIFAGNGLGASASLDWRVLIWDLESGSVAHVIDGHEKPVLTVQVYEDTLYTAGDDMTLRAWDLRSGRHLRTWGPFPSETDSCSIDEVQGRAVLGCDDGFLRVFDLESGDQVAEIEAHESGIKRVCCSPVNGDILSSAYDQKILIWDARDLTLKRRLEHRPSKWERSFNWSPAGDRVFAGTFDGTVLVWDAATGSCVDELGDQSAQPGNDCFNDVATGPGHQIAVVSDEGFIKLGRLAPDVAELDRTVEPASGRMLMNAVTLDEKSGLVVGGSHDQKLHIFRQRGGELTDEVEVFLGEGPVNSVRVCHHPGFEETIYAGCYNGTIVRVRPDGSIDGKFHLHENAVKSLRIHPTQPLGVSGSADAVLASWKLDGTPVRRFLGHTHIVDDLDIEPNGRRVASSGRDFTLHVFDLESGEVLHVLALRHRSPKGVCFFDERTVIVTTYWGELIRVSLPGEEMLTRQIARNGISAAARSSDGRHLVVSSYEGAVFLVDPASLEVVNTLRVMTQRLDGAWWS